MAAAKIGMKVEVVGKGLIGTIAFVGATQFASGKWIGVVLNEPVGKNNGSVQGKEYFKCEENYGIFVRQSQISIIEDKSSGIPSPSQPKVSRLPVGSGIPQPGRTPASSKKEKSFGSRGSLENIGSESKPSPPQSKGGSPKPTTATPSTAMPQQTKRPSVGGPAVSADEFLELQKKILDKDRAIKDLEEKLETLKYKRAEDKAKMKDLEKARMQLEQMIEYKSKWQEAQRDLQNQLSSAKKDLKDALQNKDTHTDELTELQEAVEMATLDKEMAEEKLEALQQENEQLKDKVEEVTLDLEILKNEISEGGMEGAAANAQIKQMEQQNSRLKEAIMRLKEVQVSDKAQVQSLQKQVKDVQNTNTTLQTERDRLSADLQDVEAALAEFKEQVDTALGAEEMVETLTDKNLELEEEIQQLKETVQDLEALRDLNEELEETHIQTESDLREELDLGSNRVREAEQKLEAAQESIVDYQQTIAKFRELVTKLQESNRLLQDQREDSEKQQIADIPSPEIMDIKIKLAEVKSHAKTLDVELRKFELEQANEQIKMLSAFLPESFIRRGGDNDSILLMLLIPRLIFKIELLQNQLKQKCEIADCLENLERIDGSKGEELSFATALIYRLSSLQAIIKLFERAVTKCDQFLFNKMVGIYPELAAHEKSLDTLIDQLRKDELDGAVNLDPLDKATSYYNTIAKFHLSRDPAFCTEILTDQLSIASGGVDAMAVEVERLKKLAKNCDEGSSFGSLVQDMELRNVEVKQLCRKIKRRMPQESSSTLSYSEEVQNSLAECIKQQIVIVRFGQDLAAMAYRKSSSLQEHEHLLSGQLEEMALRVAGLVFTESGDATPKESASEAFHSIISFLSSFAIKMQEGEYDAEVKGDAKIVSPFQQRAKTFKSELFDTAGVEEKLVKKDNDLLDMKKTMKLKNEELSQANIRIGLLEKRLENASKDADTRVESANRKIEQMQTEMKKKEREFEETMDALQNDIDTLEREKADTKKRLDAYSKKSLLADLARHASTSSGIAAVVAGAAAGKSPGSPMGGPLGGGPGATQQPVQVVIKDSPIILAQVESLKVAMRHLKHENIRVKSQQLKSKLEELPEIFVPPRIKPRTSPQEQEKSDENVKEKETGQEMTRVPNLNSVTLEADRLLEKLQLLSATPRVVDITNRKPGTVPALTKLTPASQLIERTALLRDLQRQKEELQRRIQTIAATQHPGGRADTAFSSFLSPTFSKVLQEKAQAPQLGRISIPATGHVKPAKLALTLRPQEFRKVHALFAS